MRFIPDGSGPLLTISALVAAIAIGVTACQPADAVPETPDTTPVQSPAKLIYTTPEGCKVYRITDRYDSYSAVYVHSTVCPNTATASNSAMPY